MKIKNLIAVTLPLLLCSCAVVESKKEDKIMQTKSSEFFKYPDGRSAKLYQLRCADGFGVDISDHGATIIALYTPDRNGKLRNVALSWADPARYINHPIYLGALVGRLANRVSNARFVLDDKVYQLLPNDRKTNSLHGGFGISGRLWQVEKHTDKELVLTLKSLHGDGGFPGTLDITARYTVSDDHKLTLEITAVPDRKTVADFTSHVYLNLNGEGSGDCSDHSIMMKAARRTEVNEMLIPTGNIPEVAGTAYDLQKERNFADIRKDFPNGLDDNYVLQDKCGIYTHAAAVVSAPESGIRLVLSTDRPGIQFYMANCLQNKPGRSGNYVKFGGFCLETQNWPDAVNRPEFPSPVITPEEPYRSCTEWKFETF
ncbi:MAG: galactose mutarotase [Lentisphaeria bacterium]|nr:galactose mutarotase [Lentisphaeria bacterium]